MKRKFPFLKSIKTTAPVKTDLLNVDPVMSPETSPTIEALTPYMERPPPLSPQDEASLRLSCVTMVRGHDPSSARAYERLNRCRGPPNGLAVKSATQDFSAQERPPSVLRPVSSMPFMPTSAPNGPSHKKATRSISLNQGMGMLDVACGFEAEPAPARPQSARPASDSSKSTAHTDLDALRSDAQAASTGVTSVHSPSHTPVEKVSDDVVRVEPRTQLVPGEDLLKAPSQPERPGSRGSRIMGMLRPASSRGSLHSAYSAGGAGQSWWRGNSLRKKTSNMSIRSDRDVTDQVESPKEEVNLNRALPPLPSLSTWNADGMFDQVNQQEGQEEKQKQDRPENHDQQVSKPQSQHSRTKSQISTAPASTATLDWTRTERVATEDDEEQRKADLQQIVLEKMKFGNIAAPPKTPTSISDGRSPTFGRSMTGTSGKSAIQITHAEDTEPAAKAGGREGALGLLKRQLSKLGSLRANRPTRAEVKPRCEPLAE